MDTYFRKELVPGKPIRPFLVTGVLEKDYTGERTNRAAQACLEEMLEQAQKDFAQKKFREFDSFTLCGMKGKWTVCDAQSPRYADGHYYVMEKAALMPVYLELESGSDQEIMVRTQECRLVMLLNGNDIITKIYIPENVRAAMYSNMWRIRTAKR